MSKQVIIAANPTAGAHAIETRVGDLASAIERSGVRASVQTDLKQLGLLVEQAQTRGELQAVIAAGGDGTAAAVANIVASDVPLIPYPLGTENLLARYLGVRADPEQICNILEHQKTMLLDAGSANGRLFLLMASCGIDAEVVRRVQRERRGHIDHLTYVRPIIGSLHEYPYPEIRVAADAWGEEKRTSDLIGRWAFVINLPMYAGGLKIVPEALGTDGQLDVCVFKRGSFVHDLVNLTGVLLGQHERWSDCQVRQAPHLRIEADHPVPYQLDGDFGGYLPLEIDVLPKRVTFLVPP